MSESKPAPGASPAGSPEPSRRLQRLLRLHAARVAVVQHAEFDYHGAVLLGFLRGDGRAQQTSSRRIDRAFATLTKAVAALQGSQVAVRSLAEAERISLEAVCAMDKAFEYAIREYADYLAARSHDQLWEVARRGPFRGRGRSPTSSLSWVVAYSALTLRGAVRGKPLKIEVTATRHGETRTAIAWFTPR